MRTFRSKYIDAPMLAILLTAGTLSTGIGLLIAEEERAADSRATSMARVVAECEENARSNEDLALRAVDLAEVTTIALHDCIDALLSVQHEDEACGLAL
jgi:hypothetical protein